MPDDKPGRYVLTVKAWVQTAPDNSDAVTVTKVLTGAETVKELMDWIHQQHPQHFVTSVTLTVAS